MDMAGVLKILSFERDDHFLPYSSVDIFRGLVCVCVCLDERVCTNKVKSKQKVKREEKDRRAHIYMHVYQTNIKGK